MKSFVYGTLAILGLMACVTIAAPEPAIVQGLNDWTVEVSFEHPQQIILKTAPDEKPRRFWYTLITLTNKTNRDVDFYPLCEMMTDTFQITPSGKTVSSAVFEKIRLRHQSAYPFLENLEMTTNKVLQGGDNAKDIAVIWPDFDPKAKSIKLFFSGLSNETVIIDHPVEKDQAGRPAKVFLRKTLELNYKLGGDPAFRSDVKMIHKGKRWVMR